MTNRRLLPVHQWNDHLFIFWPRSDSNDTDDFLDDVQNLSGAVASPSDGFWKHSSNPPLSKAPGKPPPEPGEKKDFLFTRKELREIHSRSAHSHWRRMADFLRRARPDRCPPDVRKQMQNIVKVCKACAIYDAPPRRKSIFAL